MGMGIHGGRIPGANSGKTYVISSHGNIYAQG